ncbi:MAG: 3-isopropylmalate dehydratase [Dehalococcoidia bacterium]|nr:3-isopropylmalate dehydratase [Dehalococcoidia bacterium]
MIAFGRMKGKAWTFGDIMDVDWEICSYDTVRGLKAKGLARDPETLGQYCMTAVDPDFPKKVQKGDFIVAGENFGYGHDHDHSCISIKGAGVAAVICDSTNSNFFRNSVEHGLPIVEYPGIRKRTREGDEIELDLVAGTIKNLTKGEDYEFTPYPQILLEMIEAGGIYPRLKQQIAAGEVGPSGA